MSRYHRCDPRSDYQCQVCSQDQADYERELDEATMRDRLTAICRRHAREDLVCAHCASEVWPCPDYLDAEALIDVLDHALQTPGPIGYRLIPDSSEDRRKVSS